MADFSKFRSAINGFHRADVANYIETLSTQHRAALREKDQQIEDLNRQLAQVQQELDARSAEHEALHKQLDETQTALQSTEAALDEAMVMLTEIEVPAPAEESAAEETAPDYGAMELLAYRRAEAMERAATERAFRTKQQLGELLDQVSGRYEQTGLEIQALTEDIRTNLKRLDESLSDLDAIFEETTATFDTMDPENLEDEL